jgi:hypothetical protein
MTPSELRDSLLITIGVAAWHGLSTAFNLGSNRSDKDTEVSSISLKIIENRHGNECGISTLPDLCGRDLRLIQKSNTSLSIYECFYVALLGFTAIRNNVLQRNKSGLSNLSLATNDSKDYLDKLNATKCRLQEKIEHHRTKFTESIPNRRVMTKKLKSSPQANYNYCCGIYLQKALAKVEKEIAFIQKNKKENPPISDYAFLDNLQKDINLFYEQTAQSFNQAADKQLMARSRFTNEIKYPWLWNWMAFSLTFQALVPPACALPQQAQPKTIKADPEKFICSSTPMNGTHRIQVVQNQPAILRAPVFVPPVIVYPTPSLAANAKVIDETIRYFWDWKSAQQKSLEGIFNEIPDYGNLEIWKEWYSDVQFLPLGRAKDVLTTTIKQGRETIPPNTKIIILAQSIFKRNPNPFWAVDMIHYCKHLSILSNFKGKPVVGYYPEFFGAYFGDQSPVIPKKHYDVSDRKWMYNEMEYVDKKMTFYDIDEFFEHVPDNIVFEKDLGEWASVKIAKVTHGDNGPRHDLIANVDYYRAYHIGKEIYLFNPGLMPKLVDIDTLNIDQKYPGLYRSKFERSHKLSPDARNAVDEMGEKGIFTVFSQHFRKYKISDQNPMPLVNVKHYYVPYEHLDNM